MESEWWGGILGALVECGEQLVDHLEGEVQVARECRVGGGVSDLGDGGDRVGDDHRVRVGEQVLEHVEESLVLDHLRVYVVQLRDADGRRLAHVGVLVLEALPQRLAEVLGYLLYADAAHRAHCERADERVRVLAVAHERVHRHDGHVRLRLRVVHQVEVDQLLELEVVRLHAVHHVREEGAIIHPQ